MNKKKIRKPQWCSGTRPASQGPGSYFSQKTVGGHERVGNATCSGPCRQVRNCGGVISRCREEERDVRGDTHRLWSLMQGGRKTGYRPRLSVFWSEQLERWY